MFVYGVVLGHGAARPTGRRSGTSLRARTPCRRGSPAASRTVRALSWASRSVSSPRRRNRSWVSCTTGRTGSSSMRSRSAYPEGAVAVREAGEQVAVLARPVARSPPGRRRSGCPSRATDSCGSPLRNDEDSMPSPVTAPPRVIVLSCGTTSGISPYGRVASTRCSYVVMPSTSAQRCSELTSSTPLKALTSKRDVLRARGRNRLEVALPSRTGAPTGTAAYACCSRATDSAYVRELGLGAGGDVARVGTPLLNQRPDVSST